MGQEMTRTNPCVIPTRGEQKLAVPPNFVMNVETNSVEWMLNFAVNVV